LSVDLCFNNHKSNKTGRESSKLAAGLKLLVVLPKRSSDTHANKLGPAAFPTGRESQGTGAPVIIIRERPYWLESLHSETIGAAGKNCQALGWYARLWRAVNVDRSLDSTPEACVPTRLQPSEFELEGELHLPR
jgi:hypothetical protein